MLLLDDCLSAFDPHTEAVVREEVLRFTPSQTRLIVSHKPRAFDAGDWLVYLHAGQVVRQGPPHKLFAEGILTQNALALSTPPTPAA